MTHTYSTHLERAVVGMPARKISVLVKYDCQPALPAVRDSSGQIIEPGEGLVVDITAVIEQEQGREMEICGAEWLRLEEEIYKQLTE